MSGKRFQKTRIVDKWGGIYDSKTDEVLDVNDVEHKLNEQQEQLDLYKEAILTMLGLLADKGILFSGVKDELYIAETDSKNRKEASMYWKKKCDEQQAIINNQEQKIKILQQEINDTQTILEMLTEKLKGWNNE